MLMVVRPHCTKGLKCHKLSSLCLGEHCVALLPRPCRKTANRWARLSVCPTVTIPVCGAVGACVRASGEMSNNCIWADVFHSQQRIIQFRRLQMSPSPEGKGVKKINDFFMKPRNMLMRKEHSFITIYKLPQYHSLAGWASACALSATEQKETQKAPPDNVTSLADDLWTSLSICTFAEIKQKVSVKLILTNHLRPARNWILVTLECGTGPELRKTHKIKSRSI